MPGWVWGLFALALLAAWFMPWDVPWRRLVALVEAWRGREGRASRRPDG
jgi:hypothetical protein